MPIARVEAARGCLAVRLCIRIIACSLLANSAQAAGPAADFTELSFDSLATMQVSTASRFAQATREAPSAVDVILREDIRRHGWRTLTEALNSLPGLYFVNDGAYDFAGARGFLVPGDYNTRFLLLVDGQRLNDNIYQQALLGEEFPVDLSLVERIEYVPGPGSSIYGGNAIFGVINVITRKAAGLPPLTVGGLGSSDGRTFATVTASQRLDSGATWMASVTAGLRAGRDRAFQDPLGGLQREDGQLSPDGVAYNRDKLEARRLFLRYEDGKFSLTGRYGWRQVQPSTALYNTLFDDPANEVVDGSLSLLARYEAQVSADLGLEARLEFARMTYEDTLPYLDGNGVRYLNHDDARGDWWTGELRLLHTGWAGHTLIAGVNAQIDRTAFQRNFDITPGGNPPIDISSPERRTGVYVQDEWSLGARWRMNAGLRHDVFSDAGDVTSPRLALIWLATPTRTVKLLAGKAYRPANAYESQYGNDLTYKGNPGLAPETIRTLEAVFEQELDANQQLSVALYRYRLKNLIVQQLLPGDVLQYQNQARVEARGAEAMWKLRRDSGATLTASLAGGRAEDENGARRSYSPRWIAKLRGGAPILNDYWQLAAEATWLSATPYRWQGGDFRLPARLLVNLSLSSVKVAPGLDADVRLVNLFDRCYALPASEEIPVPAVPGERRSLDVGLRYAF